jgi:hypothetical protein
LCADTLSSERPEIFALIIGENHSLDSRKRSLKYADDDALQYALLMRQLAPLDNIVVLTRPDDETRSIYQDIAFESPSRENLDAGMALLNRKMAKAIETNRVPHFYFFYTGHGDVMNNEGYITLSDTHLKRSDLIALLWDSMAYKNHVIIDACKSYFMIFERGVGGERAPRRNVLKKPDVTLPPNTGVFLSTSSASESHEWEAYQGGIFSHEMRSALRGAADLDGDKIVSYEEAAAFIWNANQKIRVHRYRPNFTARAPKGTTLDAGTLTDLRYGDGDWLTIDAYQPLHLYLEDGDGRRLADWPPSMDKPLELLIPRERPLYVRFPASGDEIKLPYGAHISLNDKLPERPTVAVRGSERLAFTNLFEKPFGAHTVREYHESPKEPPLPADNRNLYWLRQTIGVSALVAGVAGVTLSLTAFSKDRQINDDTSGLDRYRIQQETAILNRSAIGCYVWAGVAGVGYLLWTFFFPKWHSPSASVSFATGSGSIVLSGRF